MKSCYCDFDRHHHGLVTQSQVGSYIIKPVQHIVITHCDCGINLFALGQFALPKRIFEFCLSALQFHRSFPGPADVTPAEVDMLGHRYFDPTTGLYNYLQFHNDILTIGAGETGATLELTPQLPSIPVSSREMFVITHSHVSFSSTTQKARVCNIDEIFRRIRDAVYKNGIRTTEFFRDHDKLRSGVITENQVPKYSHTHTHTHTLKTGAYYAKACQGKGCHFDVKCVVHVSFVT